MLERFTVFFAQAQQTLAGGVSLSLRHNPLTALPMYFSKAAGEYIYDLDGSKFIDFFMGNGACTLGSSRPEIAEASKQVFDIGFFAEFDHPWVGQLALKIAQKISCAERVRYVNLGSEATLLASARLWLHRSSDDCPH